jgi:hypothetical protein
MKFRFENERSDKTFGKKLSIKCQKCGIDPDPATTPIRRPKATRRNVKETAGKTPSSLKFSLPLAPSRSLSHPLFLLI